MSGGGSKWSDGLYGLCEAPMHLWPCVLWAKEAKDHHQTTLGRSTALPARLQEISVMIIIGFSVMMIIHHRPSW